MTYYMNPELNKICSPIRLMLPDTTLHFNSGSKLAIHTFDAPYAVKSVRADGNTIVIEAAEQEQADMNWSGKESANLFDG